MHRLIVDGPERPLRPHGRGPLLVALLLLALFLAGPSGVLTAQPGPPDPEEQLRERLRQLEEARRRAAAANENGEDDEEADGDASQPEPLSAAELEELVDQLGSADYDTREDATRRLIDAGDQAIPFLEIAVQRRNLEIRWRARQALGLCRWGVTTDTPGVAEGLQEFLDAESPVRLRTLLQWQGEYGRHLIPFLQKVCLRDPDRQVRERAFSIIGQLGAKPEVLTGLAERCVAQDAGATWAWRALARLHHENGRDVDAIRCLQRVLDDGHADYLTHDLLARIHTARGDIDQAVVHHRAARDLAGPGNRVGHVRALAELYLQKGEKQKAGEALEELVVEDPRNYEPVFLLLDFWFEQGMVDKAAELAARCLKEWPNERALADYVNVLIDKLISAWWDRGEYARLPELMETERDDLRARGAQTAIDSTMIARGGWALARAGRDEDARKLFIEFADEMRDDAGELAQLLSIAMDRGYDDVVQHVRALGEKLPDHMFPLAEAQVALTRRNRERAAELVTNAHDAMLATGRELRFDQLMTLLPMWDAIGDDERVQELIAKLEPSAGFTANTAAALARRMTRGPSALAVQELAWKARDADRPDYDAGRAWARALATAGKIDEAIKVFEEMLTWTMLGEWRLNYVRDELMDVYRGAGRFDEVRRMLDAREAPNWSHIYRRMMVELADGNLDAARGALEAGVAQPGGDIAQLALMDFWMRDGAWHQVIRESVDLSTLSDDRRRQVQMHLARARFNTGDFEACATTLLTLLQQVAQLPDVTGTIEFDVTVMLCLLGKANRARSHFATRPELAEYPRPYLHANDARSSSRNHAGFLRVAAAAIAHEAVGDEDTAFVHWLRAWRLAALHYQADMVRQHLRGLATPERVSAACQTLAEELAPVFGDKLLEGQVAGVRHSRRVDLLVLAHALALAGRSDACRGILQHLVQDGLRNDLEFARHLLGAQRMDMRAYGLVYTPDVAVELIEWLLRPEGVPGMRDDTQPAFTDEQGTERATAAFDLCQRVLDHFPDDHRIAMLFEVAATRVGKPDHPRVAAVHERLQQPDPLDVEPAYVAAFHFTLHDWPELAVSMWRRILAMPSAQVNILSNAEEYLGRLLFRDAETREEACALFHSSMAGASVAGWTIDEDFYEAYTYDAMVAWRRGQQAVADGNADEGRRWLRLANWFQPLNPDIAFDRARGLVANDEMARARTLLRPYHAALTLLGRRLPSFDPARAMVAGMAERTGVDLPDLPEINVGGESEDEDAGAGDDGSDALEGGGDDD